MEATLMAGMVDHPELLHHIYIVCQVDIRLSKYTKVNVSMIWVEVLTRE